MNTIAPPEGEKFLARLGPSVSLDEIRNDYTVLGLDTEALREDAEPYVNASAVAAFVLRKTMDGSNDLTAVASVIEANESTVIEATMLEEVKRSSITKHFLQIIEEVSALEGRVIVDSSDEMIKRGAHRRGYSRNPNGQLERTVNAVNIDNNTKK